jgi:hypothetical protein
VGEISGDRSCYTYFSALDQTGREFACGNGLADRVMHWQRDTCERESGSAIGRINIWLQCIAVCEEKLCSNIVDQSLHSSETRSSNTTCDDIPQE